MGKESVEASNANVIKTYNLITKGFGSESGFLGNRHVACAAAAWHEMVHKLFPEQSKNISMTLTPMVFTARLIKKDFPDSKIVFVGPCAAKKLEAIREDIRSDVDFVLTFEELQGMFEAKDVDFASIEGGESLNEGTAAGRGFAVSGGVAAV